MTTQSLMLLIVYLAVLLALAYPMGQFLAKVGGGSPIRGWGWMARIEHFLYRIAGIDPAIGMNWKTYSIALLVFNALGTLYPPPFITRR